MSEPRSLSARYDPERLPNGKLISGGKLTSGRNGGAMNKVNQGRLNQLQSMVMDAICPEDVVEVLMGIKDMALNCPDNSVRLKASIYFSDRCMGRPVELVETINEHKSTINLPMDLSAEQLDVLNSVLNKMDVPEQFTVIEQIAKVEMPGIE